MLKSQSIQRDMSEVREKINTLADDADAETLNTLTGEYGRLEAQLRAALVVEEADEARDKAEQGRQDGSGAEIRSLMRLVSLVDFVKETEGIAIPTPAHELRAALVGSDDSGWVPLELLGLRGKVEDRVDAVTNVSAIQDTQFPVQPRVFNVPSAEFLGAEFPTVPVGTVSYPRLSSGTTADVRSEGVDLDGGAAVITNEQITPVRLTASYTYGVESLSNVMGFEEALRMDLQSVLMEKRDALVINGQAAVANVSPAVEGIISKLTDPTDPTDVFAWDDVLGAYDAHVDGKHATDDSSVRMLVNADTYRNARVLVVGTNTGRVLRDLLPGARFRVGAAMPATDSTIATYLTYAAASPVRGMIVPQWAGVQLVNDIYTLAKSGQRVLTAILIVGFQVADTAAYTRGEFKISA